MPIDIATAAVPSLPETALSPTHDAGAKRDAYQSTEKTKEKDGTAAADETKAGELSVVPGKDHGDQGKGSKKRKAAEEEEEFTPSEGEAR